MQADRIPLFLGVFIERRVLSNEVILILTWRTSITATTCMSLSFKEGEFNHIYYSYYSQILTAEFLSSFLVTYWRTLEISNGNYRLAQRYLRLCRRAIRTAKLFNHIYNNQNLTSVFPTFFFKFSYQP